MDEVRRRQQLHHHQLFSPGEPIATEHALAAIEAMGLRRDSLVALHVCGEWGEVSPDDAEANNKAVAKGGAIRSEYLLPTGLIVVVTTPDRSMTSIRLINK